MSEENISIFRQELERVKAQFEDMFQDIMTSVRADRENDKRTLQMVNENVNNDRKTIDQNRALNDKLETLLNVQNTMLSELRSMNNSIKDLSGGGGGGMGGILAAGGAAALAGAGAGFFLNGDGDNNVDGGGGNDVIRTTRGGGGTRDTSGGGERQPASGDVADRIRTTLMEKFTSEEMREMGIDEEKAAMLTEAFIMNFQDESGLDPDIVEREANRYGTFGRGLYQLTGPRRDEYESIYGEDYSVENQMDFMLRELTTSESSAFRRILQGETVGETASSIVSHFLRPDERYGIPRSERYLQDTRGGSAALEDLKEYQRMEEERQRREEEASAERVEGDGVTELLNRFNIDPNSLRFDEEGRLKNELYDTEGYPIRLSPKDAEELSQGLGIELPSSMEELRSALASRDVAVEYEDRFSPGTPTSSNTEELIGRSNETIRKYYAERLGLPEDISMKEIREYMLENDISSAPALKSVMIGRGGVEDIGGMFRDLEYVGSRVQPASGPHRTVSGRPAEHMDYSQGLLAAKLTEGSPLTEYLARRETLDGGGGDDIIDGGDGSDTLEPQDTPLGPRIPEEPPTEPSEETPTAPTEFPTLAEQFRRGESPTSMTDSMTGMDLAPAVEDALRPDLPEPPTEEDPEETPRETTSGGYTRGGGGSREPEQPQIESNAIGRFPWADKLIKYYNLSDMIKTNMLS